MFENEAGGRRDALKEFGHLNCERSPHLSSFESSDREIETRLQDEPAVNTMETRCKGTLVEKIEGVDNYCLRCDALCGSIQFDANSMRKGIWNVKY
jgi:hypothetical protein